MSFWSDKKVVVTGGTGFLGHHVAEALQREGCRDVFIARSKNYDLTKEENAIKLLQDTNPDIVIHLAGLVGGILANEERPAEFFYQNATMCLFMLHHSWQHGVKKFSAAVAGCGYPEHAPLPLKEESFWDGFPQWESSPYSIAKRLLHIQALAYERQYGFVSILSIPGNIYGPYDNFDLQNAHVVPALVRKFVDAAERGDKQVTVWGTGKPTRDFVYAGDVARGMLLATQRYDQVELVNLSSGKEHSIREVVEILAELTQFDGDIVWDTSRPDGQARRCFDISKARRDLSFEAQTSLREGLHLTVDWYRQNKDKGVRK